MITRIKNKATLTRARAFTLVEMLMVLTIITILAGLGLTAMQHIGRATALASGVRQFADYINMARNYAVANSQYLYLVIATKDTTNAQENAYTTYGICAADPSPVTIQALNNTTNVVYVEELQRLPRGVVFDSGETNNVETKIVSFPTNGTNLVLTSSWVITITPNGQILPLSRRPRFVLYEGVVNPKTLLPVPTGVSTNRYTVEINSLIGKPVVTKVM